jgi:uncharacterized membrane protein
MLVAPGIGPIVTAGVWLPPLVGVATGASTGSAAGGLIAMAGIGDHALYYRQQVQSGHFLVNMTMSRREEVQTILKQAGALEVAEVGGSESAEVLQEEPKTE